MAALAISTFGAFAQTEATAATTECQEQVCKSGEKKCHKEGAHKGKFGKKDFKKGDRVKGQRVSPFNGIELTAEQKTQLDNLRAEQKAARQANKEASKEARAEERKQFDEAVAKILTPEQYKQYEANRKAVAPAKVKAKQEMKKKSVQERIARHKADK